MWGSGFTPSPFLQAPARSRRERIRASRRTSTPAVPRSYTGARPSPPWPRSDLGTLRSVGGAPVLGARGLGPGASDATWCASDAIWCNATRICSSSSCSCSWWSDIVVPPARSSRTAPLTRCPPSPPWPPRCRVGEGQALCLLTPRMALATHVLEQRLELPQAFVGHGKPRSELGIAMCVLRHCLKHCLGREHPVQFGRLDVPCAERVPGAADAARFNGAQHCRSVDAARLGGCCKGVCHA